MSRDRAGQICGWAVVLAAIGVLMTQCAKSDWQWTEYDATPSALDKREEGFYQSP